MLRSSLAVVLVFALSASTLAVVVPVELPFVTPTSSINTLTIKITASIFSDTKTTAVKLPSDMHLNIDYVFDTVTRKPTLVNSLSFTGGSVDLNDVTFNLTLATIAATGVGGTFETPSPPGPITTSTGNSPNVTTFPTESHNVVLNRGTLKITPVLQDPTYYYLDQVPIVGTTVATGTLTTSLASVVGGVATYVANLSLPIAFTQEVNDPDSGISATITGSGTFVAEGSFSVAPPAPVAYNDPKVGNESYYRGNEDNPITVAVAQGVLVNDVGYTTLQAVQPSDPPHGSVTLNADGSFTYTPDANYNGADAFTYKAYDGTAYSNVATVSVDVISINDPPIAVNDSYAMTPDVVNTVYQADGVRINDSDVETATPSLTVSKQSDPSHAAAFTLYSGGAFQYTPVAGFRGTDSFTYRTFDGTDYSNVATVELIVGTVVPIPGDATGDGHVNEADAAVLAQYWGQSVSGAEQGDFNGDGVANAGDASIMAANWGYPGEEAAQAAVPEPGPLVLVIGLLASWSFARRRRAIW